MCYYDDRVFLLHLTSLYSTPLTYRHIKQCTKTGCLSSDEKGTKIVVIKYKNRAKFSLFLRYFKIGQISECFSFLIKTRSAFSELIVDASLRVKWKICEPLKVKLFSVSLVRFRQALSGGLSQTKMMVKLHVIKRDVKRVNTILFL